MFSAVDESFNYTFGPNLLIPFYQPGAVEKDGGDELSKCQWEADFVVSDRVENAEGSTHVHKVITII